MPTLKTEVSKAVETKKRLSLPRISSVRIRDFPVWSSDSTSVKMKSKRRAKVTCAGGDVKSFKNAKDDVVSWSQMIARHIFDCSLYFNHARINLGQFKNVLETIYECQESDEYSMDEEIISELEEEVEYRYCQPSDESKMDTDTVCQMKKNHSLDKLSRSLADLTLIGDDGNDYDIRSYLNQQIQVSYTFDREVDSEATTNDNCPAQITDLIGSSRESARKSEPAKTSSTKRKIKVKKACSTDSSKPVKNKKEAECKCAYDIYPIAEASSVLHDSSSSLKKLSGSCIAMDRIKGVLKKLETPLSKVDPQEKSTKKSIKKSSNPSSEKSSRKRSAKRSDNPAAIQQMTTPV